MARFNFRMRSHEEEGPSEEEGTEVGAPEESGGQSGVVRRILIIAGIGVILIGGWYLAQPLFFAQPTPPVSPVRPATPVPPAKASSPVVPTKESAPPPAAPTQSPSKEGATPSTTPAPPAKAAGPASPAKEPPPGKVVEGANLAPEKAAPPTKAGVRTAEVVAPNAGATSFSLQMGAMVVEGNAVALKRKLDGSGFPAVIRKGSVYVAKQIVTVGEPTGKQDAEELSRRLNVDGFPSQLMTMGGKYTPQIGAFFSLDEAIDLARELQKKKYNPKITSKPATTIVYQVRHGKFDSRAAAVRRGEELKGKGFSFLVVRE